MWRGGDSNGVRSVSEGIKKSLPPKWHRHKGLETKTKTKSRKTAKTDQVCARRGGNKYNSPDLKFYPRNKRIVVLCSDNFICFLYRLMQ